MSSSVQLVVKESFDAFGVSFLKGESFDLASAKGWPKGTLQRRIQNGFLSYDEEDILNAADDEGETDEGAVAALESKRGKGGRKFTLPGDKEAEG